MPAGIEIDFLKSAGAKPAGSQPRGDVPTGDEGAGFAEILTQLSSPPSATEKPKHPLLMVSNTPQAAGLSDVLPGLSLKAVIQGELKARTATGLQDGQADDAALAVNVFTEDASAAAPDAEAPLVLSALLKDQASLDVSAGQTGADTDIETAGQAKVEPQASAKQTTPKIETATVAAPETATPADSIEQPELALPERETPDVSNVETAETADLKVEGAVEPVATVPEAPVAPPNEEQVASAKEEQVAPATEEQVAVAPEKPAPVTQAVAAAPVPAAPQSGDRSTPQRSEPAQSILAAEPAQGKAVAVPVQAPIADQEAPQPRGRETVESVFSVDAASTAEDGLETLTAKSQQQTFTGIAAGQPSSATPAAQPAAPAAAPVPAGMAQTNAILVAAPDDIVDVVSSRVSGGERPDRIAIQLDPPELGRVSIEFKFDGQTLQHVSVTGETPEAMTKLRQMHAQLVQSLEQHGLNARDMSFSQNTPQRDPQQWAQAAQYGSTAAGADADTAPADILQPRAPIKVASGGLNIKL